MSISRRSDVGASSGGDSGDLPRWGSDSADSGGRGGASDAGRARGHVQYRPAGLHTAGEGQLASVF